MSRKTTKAYCRMTRRMTQTDGFYISRINGICNSLERKLRHSEFYFLKLRSDIYTLAHQPGRIDRSDVGRAGLNLNHRECYGVRFPQKRYRNFRSSLPEIEAYDIFLIFTQNPRQHHFISGIGCVYL